jgi:hypothetical protein
MHAAAMFLGSVIKKDRNNNLLKLSTSHWLGIYVYNWGILCSKLKSFTLHPEMRSPVNNMPNFFTQCKELHKYLYRVV